MMKKTRILLLYSAMLLLFVIQIAIAVRLMLNHIEGVEGSGFLANTRLASDLGFIVVTFILLYMYQKKEKIISQDK